MSHEKHNHYIAVTAHAVTRSFEQKSFVIGFFALNVSHNWIHLTESLSNVIQNAFPQRASTLTTVVTDQGANFNKAAMSIMTNLDKAAVEQLGPDDWDEPLPPGAIDQLDVDVTLHLCVAHRMHNAALDVLKASAERGVSYQSLIDTVRELVVHIRGSSALVLAQEEVQVARLNRLFPNNEDAPKRQPKALQLDVATRWLSMHTMVARYVDLYDDILVLALRGRLNGAPRVLSISKMAKLRAVASTFEPLAQFVRWAEGDQYVTLSLVPVMLARCFRAGTQAPGDSQTVASLKTALNVSMRSRLGSILTTPIFVSPLRPLIRCSAISSSSQTMCATLCGRILRSGVCSGLRPSLTANQHKMMARACRCCCACICRQCKCDKERSDIDAVHRV